MSKKTNGELEFQGPKTAEMSPKVVGPPWLALWCQMLAMTEDAHSATGACGTWRCAPT